MKLHCACVRASARAHTHTHIHAQHADESARGEFEPLLARTLTHGSKRARARTFQQIRARAQPDAQVQPGTHGTVACTHMRARAECARALTRY